MTSLYTFKGAKLYPKGTTLHPIWFNLLHKWRKIAPLKVQTRVTLAAPIKGAILHPNAKVQFAPYRRVQFCHLIGTSLPI